MRNEILTWNPKKGDEMRIGVVEAFCYPYSKFLIKINQIIFLKKDLDKWHILFFLIFFFF